MLDYKNLKVELENSRNFQNNGEYSELNRKYRDDEISLEEYRTELDKVCPKLWTKEQVEQQIKNVKKALQELKKDFGCETVKEYIEELQDYTGDTVDEYWVINEAHDNFITEELAYDTYSM